METLLLDDTMTIINALKLTKAVVHEEPMIELTNGQETLTRERIDRVINKLTDDLCQKPFDEIK
jgi:uncharacterized protein YlzI (FlbEa/FlbD family)